ncbi:MAG: insulinase family protein [Acidobacteria bacterium]|nr:insulinase family protein [Acidobacteriota bacterium]
MHTFTRWTVLLSMCAGAFCADVPPPLKIQQSQLANGLKIVLAEDRSRPVANLQVWYHVGSKDEKTGRTGFAHLFEHMMFRGSANVGPEEHMRLVREAGGNVNAYTNFDMTVYWETFPSNYLERMLWLEADRLASLDVSEANFKKEREVVKEERRLRYENPPYGTLVEHVLKNTFTTYPYKHSPIGSMEDLNSATIADVKAFHDLYYVPNNATLVLVGDFDAKEALALIEKQFAKIPKGKPIPRVTAVEPAQTAGREVTVKDKKAPLDAVVTAYHLPPMGHPDSYALDIASSILSSGQSSRLYKRLVYEEQSALGAQGQSLFLEGPSIFFGFAIANQGKNIKEIATSLEFTFNEMGEKAVLDEELTKAKNQSIAGFITGREGVQSKADFLGRCAVLLGDPQRYNSELAKYQAVTAADIQRVVKKYLAKSNQTKVFIAPDTGAAKPEAK